MKPSVLSRLNKVNLPYFYLKSGDKVLRASTDRDFLEKQLLEYEKRGWTVRITNAKGESLS